MKQIPLFALALMGFSNSAIAQDLDKIARMSHVEIECDVFVKLASNWIAIRDTRVVIKVSGKSDNFVALSRGTSANGLLAYGIYVQDVIEARCPQHVAPIANEAAAPGVAATPPKLAPRETKQKTHPQSLGSVSSYGGESGWQPRRGY